MDSLLTVTSAAEDRSLLTVSELRAAVGVTDSSRDADLEKLGARIEAVICRECRVPTDGTTLPTLRLETLTETFRLHHHLHSTLVLSRCPVVSIASVVECDVALTSDDYEVVKAAGMVRRLCGDYISWWPRGKIVVTYTAGWAEVPDNLKLAAARLANEYWAVGTRDPNLKRERIEGVVDLEYWVPPTSDPAIPSDVMDLLAPYINYR